MTKYSLFISQFTFHRRYEPPKHWGIELTAEEELAYLHPFGCEARAYGRLREQRLEHVAARCYGYLLINQKHQKRLREKVYFDWEVTWGFEPCHEGMPLKAIVKEFLDPEMEVGDDRSLSGNRRRIEIAMKNRKLGSNLVKNLKKLHRNGILLRDINIGNILNGLYIDFSKAWTCPHPAMTVKQMKNQETLRWYDQGESDASELDKLIDIWNEFHDFGDRIWERARANDEYMEGKLRSHTIPYQNRKRKWNWKIDGWSIMPAKFDWEAAERKRHESDTVMEKKPQPHDTKIKKEKKHLAKGVNP